MSDRIDRIFSGLAASGRVAAAYLFVGGDRAAAEQFADQLSVQKQDRFFVAPDGASFKIEQVRDLQSWVRYGPSAGKYLVATVEKADALTDQAAGAFLKTLEEPPPGVVFVLLAERADKLPLTILSRCQKILFPEANGAWRPKEEFSQLVAEFQNLPQKNALERLALSSRLANEKEHLTEILYELVQAARYRWNNLRLARALLTTIRYLQRNVNAKTALDCLCLS